MADECDSASLIPPPTPAGPSAEDIKKVVAEHAAKEAKKEAKAKDGKDGEKGKDDNGKDKVSPIPVPSPVAAVSAPSTPVPQHRKFALHRQIFDMRKAELKRKEQGVKAKEVSKGGSHHV